MCLYDECNREGIYEQIMFVSNQVDYNVTSLKRKSIANQVRKLRNHGAETIIWRK